MVGRLTTEDGLPVSGLLLGAAGNGTDEADHTGTDGSYELGPLAPGRVRIQAYDTSGYYEDYSLKIKDASGELLDPEVSVEALEEIHRDLVIVECGDICFYMPRNAPRLGTCIGAGQRGAGQNRPRLGPPR